MGLAHAVAPWRRSGKEALPSAVTKAQFPALGAIRAVLRCRACPDVAVDGHHLSLGYCIEADTPSASQAGLFVFGFGQDGTPAPRAEHKQPLGSTF